MKHSLNIYQRLIAQFLFVSLLLQSCNNSSTPIIPRMEVPTHSNQQPAMYNLTNQLVAQELTASEGHVVTLHEEEGRLLADVEVNAAAGFSKTYQDLPLYVNDENLDLAQVIALDKQQQKQLIEVKLPTRDKKGYVYVGQRGLLGGMKRGVIKKGDEGEEKEKEKEKEQGIKKENGDKESIEELLEYAQNENAEAQFRLGEIAYEAWQIQHQAGALQDARKWLTKAAGQGHPVAIALLDQINASSLSARGEKVKKGTKKKKQLLRLANIKPIKSNPQKKEKEIKVKEDLQQQELKKRIVSQLFQPAYHQQIKFELYQQLLSPTLSEQQRTSLAELTKLITAPEKKLRLGGSHEIREAFRANPTPDHQLFEPLRNHIQRLSSYQQEFVGTSIELLLKELIEKHEKFMISLFEQVQMVGPTSPFKLFESKPLLQGEGFACYEVESEKAYQLACYSPHEYEYVRGNSSGLSIGSMQGGVYFKVDDGRGLLKPAKEHAVYTLYQALGLTNLISPTHLVVMNGLAVLPADIGESPERRELQRKKQELNTPSTQEVFNHYPELEQRIRFAQHEYPLRIQGSLVVVGKTLEKFLEEAEKSADAEAVMNQLEPTSFSSHVLASLLLLPTDYKSDNLMVDVQNRIIGIDNDACLEAQELRELRDGKSHGVSIKNILYLLPLMQAPVASDIRAKFINHHPGILLLDWLIALRAKQGNYDNLLDASLLDQENVDLVKRNVEESLGLPLRFVPGWITGMYERFIELQQLLKDDPNIKHQALFQAIHPYASRYYQGLKKLYPYLLDQMAFVYDKMGNLNNELSNNLESLLAKYSEPGDQDLLKKLSETSYQEQEASLGIDQAIQELIASVNLKAYTAGQQLAWIERVVALHTWPAQLHPSWYDPALLIQMVQAGASKKAIQALIEKAGAQIDAKDESGETVLHAAVRRGGKNARKQLSMLVQLGANLEAQNQKGDTPLELAAEQKDVAVFKHLVMLGAGEKAIASTINCFYQSLNKKEKQQLVPYITKLTQVNPKVGWKISLNEIFPVQGKAKATLSTVTERDRVITKSVWNSLFQKDGNPKKTNAYGVRPVSFVEKNGQRIYVKFFPQLPGTELAVIRLAENLLGYCTPYCELASINGIPVLLTQGVPGETLYEVLQKDPERLKQLDPESVSKSLILAMLVNPGDGNLGNYIVSPFISREGQIKYRLISIDNDQAFMPAVAKQIKTGSRSSPLSLQVKTILYCLDAMKEPVSQKIIQQIQEKDLVELLANWLSSLKIHHEAAKNHFDSGLLKKYQEDKASVIGVSFAPGMIKQLFTKLMRLQTALSKQKETTHLELLSILEPLLANRYSSVLNDSTLSVIEKYERVEKIKGEQALTSSSNTLPRLLISRDIPKLKKLQAALWSGEYGPDKAFKELQEVKEQHINLEQIFTELDRARVEDLRELPASLVEEMLQEADLTRLSVPQQRTFLEAIKDQELRYVCLRNCNALTKAMLTSFSLDLIKKLDVSNCSNLGAIASGVLRGAPIVMPALTHLRLDQSGVKTIRLEAEQLKKLSARNCSQLKKFELMAPQLEKLDIRGTASLNKAEIEYIFGQFPGTFIYLAPTLAFLTRMCATYLNKRGIAHYNRNEYKLAVHFFRQAAEHGHADAQFNMGMMYENGREVDKDDHKAVAWYKKAAEEGHADAQYKLGVMYENGKGVDQDDEKAVAWYTKAADQAHVIAPYKLGVMYENGKGIKRDDRKAVRLYKKSAKRQYMYAQYLLGNMYYNGQGIARNYEESFQWYQKAAKQGHSNAQNMLGCMYEEGRGVDKDDREAVKWYQKAADQGDTDAHNNIGNMYYNGHGVIQDYQEALKWYQKAANQGSVYAQFSLGFMYENGQGVDQDYQEAIKWYQKAANQGHAGGQFNLGWAHQYGRVVSLNYEKAFEWYQKAAEQGHIGAQWSMASLYAEGKGIEKDNRKAQSWMKRSDEEIRKWPRGNEILTQLKSTSSDTLDLTTNYSALNFEQYRILLQHPHFKHIHVLILRGIKIVHLGIQELVKTLIQSQIYTLDLSCNQIGDKEVIKLTEFLPNTQIHTLDLGFNEIDDEGAIKLSEALPASHIHTLYLSNNKIGDSGTQALAQSLPHSQIHTLDLSWNKIGTEGATKLSGSLPNTQIHTLSLSWNEIGDEGAINLAEALPKTQIHTLSLSWNEIGDEGAIKLAEALPKTQIHTLDLSYNNIGKETQSLLKEKFPHIQFSF